MGNTEKPLYTPSPEIESHFSAGSVEHSSAHSLSEEVNSIRRTGGSLVNKLAAGYTVVKDVAAGVADELVNHKLDLATDMAVGAGFTSISKAEPRLASAAGFALTGAGASMALEHVDGMKQTLKDATGDDAHTKVEAEQHLKKFGAGATELGAVFFGAYLSRKLLRRSESGVNQALHEVRHEPLTGGPQLELFKAQK